MLGSEWDCSSCVFGDSNRQRRSGTCSQGEHKLTSLRVLALPTSHHTTSRRFRVTTLSTAQLYCAGAASAATALKAVATSSSDTWWWMAARMVVLSLAPMSTPTPCSLTQKSGALMPVPATLNITKLDFTESTLHSMLSICAFHA